MSKSKQFLDFQESYENFESPYTGIATMVFVQAASDLAYLNGKDRMRKDGGHINKWEIINFFYSRWAAFLGGALDIDRETLKQFAREYI